MPERRRGHRPRRAVVVRHLRRLREAVPGRHRARRPHHRHAPLPGAGRVELPGRAQRALQGPGEQGQPVEHVARTPGWTGPRGCDFEVKQVGEDVETLDEVDWLFWVGCAGAYEDRAKKTTRAVAELLDMAGVSFAVLGNGETCTGDPARRAGNEFVFQQLAMQNAEMFKETKVKKVVSTCAHCFNTLKNEYAEFGVELEVVHHTQLLNRLVREGRLTPVAAATAAPTRTITYHDPCYIGRHNRVYAPPRELLERAPRRRVQGDAAQQRALVLLRRRRCPDVDGGEDRRADQRQPHHRGRRHRRRPDRGRLPVLPGDALRRPHRAAGRRQGPRGGRGARRRPDAAGVGEAAGRPGRPSRPPPRPPRPSPPRAT